MYEMAADLGQRDVAGEVGAVHQSPLAALLPAVQGALLEADLHKTVSEHCNAFLSVFSNHLFIDISHIGAIFIKKKKKKRVCKKRFETRNYVQLFEVFCSICPRLGKSEIISDKISIVLGENAGH